MRTRSAIGPRNTAVRSTNTTARRRAGCSTRFQSLRRDGGAEHKAGWRQNQPALSLRHDDTRGGSFRRELRELSVVGQDVDGTVRPGAYIANPALRIEQQG